MSESEYRPNKLLCVVAHPDDVEVTIGATIAKWVNQGTEVCLLVCTDGANGTSDTNDLGEKVATVRAREEIQAAKILGIHCWHQLHFADGSVEPNDDLRREIVRHIRAHQPDAVFTMDPAFLYSTRWRYPNHRDHRAVGQAAFDAVYPMARDVGSFPELLYEGLEPHAVANLIMTNYERENMYVDVTEHFDTKADALRAHASQFGDASWVIRRLREHAQASGEAAGCELAEGFVHLPIFGE